MSVRILIGHVLDRLAELPDESVNCVVTSPPYYGLRDYGVPGQIGLETTLAEYIDAMTAVFRDVRRVLRPDGVCWLNIGDSYAGGKMGRSDHGTSDATSTLGPDRTGFPNGTNVGYAVQRPVQQGFKPKDLMMVPARLAIALQDDGWYLRSEIIWHKPNPMPESVTDRPTNAHEHIFLLTKSARYWYDADAVRTPLTDVSEARQGRADLRGKDGWSDAYHGNPPGGFKRERTDKQRGHGRRHDGFNDRWDAAEQDGTITTGANLRNVWSIATVGFPGAHFATFPPEIPRRCIKAGTSEKGACSACGACWTGNAPSCSCDMGGVYESDAFEIIDTPTGERAGDDPTMTTGRKGMNRPRGDAEGTRPITRYEQRAYARQLRHSPHRDAMQQDAGSAFDHYIRTDTSGARPVPSGLLNAWIDKGWITPVVVPTRQPHPVVPCTVLDPFFGSGTTGLVADQLGRDCIGIELNPDYAAMAEARIRGAAPMLAEVKIA